MISNPLVSIIINNYNYERFLVDAINSALDQTYQNKEVIVVDDGSNDNSRSIINSYGDRVIPLFKENGGQTSAMNCAFNRSTGDVIIFIDADDVLEKECIENAVRLFESNENVIKVHWPLAVVDEATQKIGENIPKQIAQSAVLEQLLSKGPDAVLYPPTSGNAWSKVFLKQVMPLPEIDKELGLGSASADACLSILAPLYGEVKIIPEPQGFYRVHGNNDFAGSSFEKKLKRNLAIYDHLCSLLKKHCERKGIIGDVQKWKDESWDYKISQASTELLSTVAPEESFLFVDEQQWGMKNDFCGRKVLPFTERNGQYWGVPDDDKSAIEEIEFNVHKGVDYIIFSWPAFWWLDYYASLKQYLFRHFKNVVKNERLIAFDLRPEPKKLNVPI
jgi:glycosyltransferase involved in cell wall biosynthesis